MVSQDSNPNPASSMLQQLFISDSINSQNQFETHNFNNYGSDLRGNHIFPQSVGVIPSIQSLGERMARSIDLVQASNTVPQESEISHTRHLMDLLGAANATNHQLSLSLGSHMFASQVQYRQRSVNSDLVNPSYMIPGEEARKACNPGVDQVNDEYSFSGNAFGLSSAAMSSSSNSYGTESFAIAIKNSRYLKPTQTLLEEIVSVSSRAVEINNEKYMAKLLPGGRRGALGVGLSSEYRAELCCNGLVPSERHDLQVKIAKLIALLEEIEGRYEKYYHQMEQAVSSFEEIAGLGAAKSYTSLALQAMSRHFCNLRDAIVSQINVTRRKFSQDSPKISTGLSRLSLFDIESGQNRMSLQQLGMFQNQRQAWRPIRGLPETSVAILRSWLFKHFLHPYPNDSEKLMLASQTGLTKNQVSNWFINARVRLWKPMIEEMYKEEFAESCEDSNPLILGSSSSTSMTMEGVTDNSEE